MPQNCLGTIRSYYPKFSEKEKKIADYILENPEVIIHRTINEVADDLNVADATVFRFSKRIGFKGFQAMKIALASETMTSTQSALVEKVEKLHKMNLTEKIFNANIQALQKTFENIESRFIEEAIAHILEAKRIEVYGTGASAVSALIAAQKLLQSGFPACASLDAHSQLLSASLLTKKDAAIFISHTGTSEETFSLLKTIKKSEAKTIVITSDPHSALSINADITLPVSIDETDNQTAFFTFSIAQQGIIDALCVNILHQHEKDDRFPSESPTHSSIKG
ncbi:MurR/RpiR family transcriptional regulator [Neobacillus sp. SM06]|uniref:MurR/RpiR family transcriptional regulator n=1 Tax=Neobacillus sp. SM06 TaxID=3422492 RepID=UPI003D28494B